MKVYTNIPVKYAIIFLCGALFYLPLQVWAVACDAIFTNGIQATGASGNISLSYHSLLTGGSATLKAKTLTDNSSWVACSGSSCAASGTAATTSTPTFLTGSATNGNISIGYQGSQNMAAGDYGTVSVGQGATLTTTTNNGVYKTKAFSTSYQSVLNLQPGDYWINGDLTLAQETVLARAATTGSVRIFVNGNISLAFKVSTSGFTSDQLLIYATGSITSANEANLTAFIYAGGNVSFNYMSVINGGVSGASFTASGNQVTVNYQSSALANASFSPFCSGTTSSAVLLGSWHMDEGSWNGTASEVIDSSGKGNHGRARIAAGSTSLPSTTSGSPAYTSGLQSTCRYGTFDSTSSPIRTYTYVELSGFPTLPNGFTFAAWIRSTNAGAQHQRILVRDDAQNGWGLSLADGTGQPKLRFFARNVTNSGAVTGQGTNPGCGVFCIDTNAVITSNSWFYVASVVDTTAKTITLYVYNASGVLQAKTSGAYSGTWTDGTGTAAIGGETSASSEGTQSSWHFLGNIDEVNIYSGALTQTSIEALLPTVRTCPAPDHYELEVPATGLACLGTNVTVRACADSAVPCNQDNTVNTNVSLATTVGTLGATTLTLSSGSGSTVLKNANAVDGSSATITLSGESTAATNARKCCTGSSSCSVANSCATTFNTAGFVFSNTASGATGNIPTESAGNTDTSVYLRALKTNTSTGACTARLNTTLQVPLAFQCRNPSTCVTGQSVTLNSTTIQGNANSAASISYTNVPLAFDAQGSAAINLTYSDVGQIRLLTSLVLPATTTDPAITLSGTSNDFVVKPYTMAVSSVTTTTGVANPGGTTVAGTGAGFVAAGANFKVNVEARNKQGALTPNYGNESTPETVALQNLSLVYPSTGGTATSLTVPNPFSATTPAGTFTNSTVSWNQVGSFTVQPHVGDGSYLGVGDVQSLTTSSTIGRIYPDHFRVSISPVPTLTNSCGSFTYMDQPMSFAYTLQAESTGNVILSNYGSGYSTTTPTYVAENADGANGASLSSRFSAGVTPSWAVGTYVVSSSTATYARLATPTLSGAPLTSLQIGLQLTDTFDGRSLQSMDMNAGSSGSCGAGCNAKAIGSLLNLRYGRLRLDNAFGPETTSLPVNFVTEYWTGNYFAMNTSDSCTLVPRSAITYPAGALSNDAYRTVALTGGTTQGVYALTDANYIHINAGTAGQYFSAPTNKAQGSFIVKTTMSSLSWLTFDWDQNGTYTDNKLPDATFTFGSYRGNDRLIYWREKLQ